MSLELLLNDLNKSNKFKFIIFIFLALPSFQNYGQLQNALIAVYTPDFECLSYKSIFNSNANSTKLEDKACMKKSKLNKSILLKCNHWNFTRLPFGETQVSEFSLVCDKSYYGDLLLLSWYSTSLISPLIGILSDKFGRKKIALANLTLETVMSIILAFSPNYVSNLIIRLILGVSGSGLFVCFVWLMEMIDDNFRTFAGSFYWCFGCLAYTSFPLIVYYTRNWRLTQLISVAPNLFYLAICFIPESPRWLLATGRKTEAFKVLNSIKKFNKVLTVEIDKEKLELESNDNSKFNIRKPIKSRKFLLRTLVAFLVQFSTFIFWGAVTINLNQLTRFEYLNIFLMGLMEFPSLVFSYFSLKYLRRKQCILIYGGTGATMFLISVFLSRGNRIQVFFRILIGCIAKISIATVIQTTLVYVTELFPTTHRTFGIVFIQIANFLSFVGAIYINKLDKMGYFVPMVIYFVLFWCSYTIGEIFLPETKDLPLPQTIDDIEHLRRGWESNYLTYMRNKNLDTSHNENSSSCSLEPNENQPLITHSEESSL